MKIRVFTFSSALFMAIAVAMSVKCVDAGVPGQVPAPSTAQWSGSALPLQQPNAIHELSWVQKAGGVSFDADSSGLMVAGEYRTLNLLDAALERSFGPSLAVVAVILLLFVRSGARSLRRKSARLQGKCEKCGYRLTGLESSRCPECGTPKVSISSSHRSRHAIVAVILAITGIVSVCLYLWAYPRIGGVVGTESIAAAQWADAHKIEWLRRKEKTRNGLASISGAGSRPQIVGPPLAEVPWMMHVSSVGGVMVLGQKELFEVRSSDGTRILRSYFWDPKDRGRLGQSVQVDSEGRLMYVSPILSGPRVCNLQTAQAAIEGFPVNGTGMFLREQTRSVAKNNAVLGRAFPIPRSHLLLDVRTSAVSLNDPLAEFDDHPLRRVQSGFSEHPIIGDVGVSSDGRRVYASVGALTPSGPKYNPEVAVWDVESDLQPMTPIASPNSRGVVSVVCGPKGRWVLVVSDAPYEVHQWDVDSEQWLAGFDAHRLSSLKRVEVRGDGTRFFVCGDDVSKPGTYTVLEFNLNTEREGP